MFGLKKEDNAGGNEGSRPAEPAELAGGKPESKSQPIDEAPKLVDERKQVTKDTPIAEAAKSSPFAAEILMSFGLHCIGCGMTAYETIEQGLAGHGIEEETIQALVDELNEAADEFHEMMQS